MQRLVSDGSPFSVVVLWFRTSEKLKFLKAPGLCSGSSSSSSSALTEVSSSPLVRQEKAVVMVVTLLLLRLRLEVRAVSLLVLMVTLSSDVVLSVSLQGSVFVFVTTWFL